MFIMELKGSSVFIFVMYCIINMALAASDYCMDHGYTPKYGSRNPSYQPGLVFFTGSMIRYKCDEFYKLEPDEAAQTCTRNNDGPPLWIPKKPPVCVKVPTCSRPEIEHANVYKDIFHEGDHLNPYFSCEMGFTTLKENDSVCLNTGEWSTLPVCVGKNCTDPPAIEHGSFRYFSYWNNPNFAEEIFSSSNSWPPGTTIFYTCDQGYILESDGSVTSEGRVCTNGEWSGPGPECVREGCNPPDPTQGNYIPKQSHYEVHNTLTYICYPDDDVTRTCQSDHSWSGTPCPRALTTEQMPHTSHTNVYCSTPLPVSHGTFECCSEKQVTQNQATEDPKYCCPVHGLVEFVCDSGFVVKGEATQWICGSTGQWVSIDSPQMGSPTPPTCYSNMTRPEPNPMPDDMLKPVIGTAAGVLVILSAAIIVAFCRPKIKDMKRRWREHREDEDELIIDGRRIILPSYEEAVTSHDPYIQITGQEQSTSSSGYCRGNFPSTSYSHNARTNSIDDTSLILHVHPDSSRDHPRISSSSDEEMLVPESSDTLSENLTEENSASNNRISQSLLLKAGTTVNACVLINHTLNSNQATTTTNGSNKIEQANDESSRLPEQNLHINDPLTDFSSNNYTFSSNHTQHKKDVFVDLENESEANMDSIYPQTIMLEQSKNQARSPFGDESHNLLSYPLIPRDGNCSDASARETISINIDTGNIDITDSDVPEATEESSNSTDGENEDATDSLPIIANSDHIHIVMSSQATTDPLHDNMCDETGSTTV